MSNAHVTAQQISAGRSEGLGTEIIFLRRDASLMEILKL